jgi:hypothetical protein
LRSAEKDSEDEARVEHGHYCCSPLLEADSQARKKEHDMELVKG